MKKIIRHAILLLRSVTYYLYTYFHIKDNKLWLFGAWKGTTYNDNSKYLFEYVLNNYPDINAFWVTKNRDVYDYLNNKGYPVKFYPSKEANRMIAKAGYLFQTEGYRDIGYFPVARAKVIQLWHGSPIKNLARFKRNSNALKDILIRLENGDRRSFRWTSTSDFYTSFHNKVFDIPLDKFINTGSPRCDAIMKNDISLIDEIKMINDFDKTILYLPTHRNWGEDFNFDFILEGLNIVEKKLRGSNICFVYKPHPNEANLIKSKIPKFNNIIVLDGLSQKQQDLYDYLYKCDLLVSDYSSVAIDYLLLDNPIVLFPYDLENYIENDGGVTQEYFDVQVGPFTYSWDQMILKAMELLEFDNWKEKRFVANKFYNEFNAGNSCEKIVDFILNEI